MRSPWIVAFVALALTGCNCGSDDGKDAGTDGGKDGGTDGGAGDVGCTAVGFGPAMSDVLVQGANVVPATGFTWELWFNANQLPSSTAIKQTDGADFFVAADGVSCEDIYLGFGTPVSPANQLAFSVDGLGGCPAADNTPLTYNPTTPFATGRWYFIAASHDYGSGTSKLYVDGAMVASKVGTKAAITRTLPLTIGRWSDRANANYNVFQGSIDEVVVRNRVMTDAEVTADYNAGAGVRATATSDVTLGLHFDDGMGATAVDFSATPHNGALEAGATWVHQCAVP